jgi:xanthine dehydrogenase molybdenum-binding subunit
VYDHQQIAKVLNLDPAHVEIALCASGGAFGAKEELSIQAQTAIAARLLDRPVKTVLTREQSTQHHVKRHAMTIALTVGADDDGHLLALRSRIVADAGGYHTTSAKCALRAACHSCGVYRVPNVDVESKAVYTNNPNAGCDARASAATRRSSRWKASWTCWPRGSAWTGGIFASETF